jgi:hypothetical protein
MFKRQGKSQTSQKQVKSQLLLGGAVLILFVILPVWKEYTDNNFLKQWTSKLEATTGERGSIAMQKMIYDRRIQLREEISRMENDKPNK